MSETLRVASGAAELAVRVDGATPLPWLVLSNSLATNMSLWDGQMDALTRIRRVVRYDTRGHGASSATPGAYDFALLCGDAVAIMDRLGIASADILGLSLGGMTALGLGLDHGERIDRVLCCCARGDMPPPAVTAWDERIAAVKQDGLAAVAEATLGRWFTETTHRDRPDIVNAARDLILSASAAGYCGCAEAIKGVDYTRRLGALDKPTLYAGGQHDGAAPPAAMREMAKATPHGRYEEIPGAAHIANMENAAGFTRVIVDFLQDRGRGLE